uniref:Thyroglobulin type-1 domain-containing protein n=1 Tax=Anopheles stephensi TaxID=30069 RepID=A0A182YD27_ANOST
MTPPIIESWKIQVPLAVILVAICNPISAQLVPDCSSTLGCLSYPADTSCPSPDEFWSPTAVLGGCCPGCVRGLSLGTPCSVGTTTAEPTHPDTPCAPGLVCGLGNVCRLNTGDCLSTHHVPAGIIDWVPQCDRRGQYAPKQCRGDRINGRCFCYSAEGKRIFGWAWRNEAQNMTCACSRRRAELEAEGRFDVTLHCTRNGNYEELQCDQGVCWCADPQTGFQKPGTRAVPQDSWTLLPCYNGTLYGAQYLRRCESVAFSQILQRKQFIIRGHTGVTFTDTLCEYDGSHGRYIIEGQEASCTWHDGTRIDPYKTSLQNLAAMNCNCARDVKLFMLAGRKMELACEGNGNYVPLQSRNGALFCVDPDGFVVAENVPAQTNCEQYIFGAVTTLLLGLSLSFIITVGGAVDPPTCDSSYGCVSSIRQEDCAKGEILISGGSLNGCCPGCQGGRTYLAVCNMNIPDRRCAPGLKCSGRKCIYDRSTCLHTMHLDRDLVGWIPKCNLDGTYAAKQCRGDRLSGRCFCYSEDGKRIFGWDWYRNTEHMTCACSRRRDKLEKEGRFDVTLHCTQNGNYEELQCDSGLCWCADEFTGSVQLGTTVVHDSLWQLLPCYNSTLHGESYLRQCESAAHAQKIILKKFYTRGTVGVTFNEIPCDYDGAYGRYKVENGVVYCTWRDGKKIGSFQIRSSMLSSVNCYCARDTIIYREAGIPFTLACGGNGNYEYSQDQNGQLFCVDSDGFVVTTEVAPNESCDKFIYNSAFYNED